MLSKSIFVKEKFKFAKKKLFKMQKIYTCHFLPRTNIDNDNDDDP